jgi:hypothetical protein
MKTPEQYEEMSKMAAYKVISAFGAFSQEPPHIQAQSRQIIMQRVSRMLEGENVVMEGNGLVREIKEPEGNDTV